MARLTTGAEAEALAASGRVAAGALHAASAALQPGVTTAHLNDIAENYIRARGGVPSFLGHEGYPASLCVSINDEVVHGIPSASRTVSDGDIVGLDVGVILNGWYTDTAITVGVGNVDPVLRELVDRTEASLAAAIAAVKPGATTGDIGAAVEASIAPFGYGIIRALCGHGVGKAVHEPPQIPNYGKPGTGTRLEEGMVLAIEPMIALGRHDVRTLDDGWTIVTTDGAPAAHFEHTVLVTKRGAKIITKE